MNGLDTLRQSLSENGFSLTRPRRIIFEKLDSHMSLNTHELIHACAQSIDKASVYRTLSLFESLGIVKRVQLGWKYKYELSDIFQPHHHHLYCTSCTNIMTLPADEDLEKRLRKLASSSGFTPISHEVEIKGICAACQNAKQLKRPG